MDTDCKKDGFQRVMEEGKEIFYIRPRVYAGLKAPFAKITTRYEIINRSIVNINKGYINYETQ